jgi:uncharacterized protein YbaR (Trm112 family)
VIAKELLELLACPKCHAELAAHAAPGGTEGFVCNSCKLFFALDDGLPNMLLEEARPWPLSNETTA